MKPLSLSGNENQKSKRKAEVSASWQEKKQGYEAKATQKKQGLGFSPDAFLHGTYSQAMMEPVV
jgi:hypothetical protein